jgi:hypothetical protein
MRCAPVERAHGGLISSVDGEIRYTHTVADTVLTTDERAMGMCLSYRAVPVTDVVVRLQAGDRLRSVWPSRLNTTQTTLACPDQH